MFTSGVRLDIKTVSQSLQPQSVQIFRIQREACLLCSNYAHFEGSLPLKSVQYYTEESVRLEAGGPNLLVPLYIARAYIRMALLCAV